VSVTVLATVVSGRQIDGTQWWSASQCSPLVDGYPSAQLAFSAFQLHSQTPPAQTPPDAHG